uniref:Secreted protein n=1 Tax=Oryza brachyantha TaxID=4533 RepID=J3LKU5_ORYBR
MDSCSTATPLFLALAVAVPASSVSDVYPSFRCSADGRAAGTVAAGRCRFRWLRRSSLHHSFRLWDGSTRLDARFFSMTWSALRVVFTDAVGLASGAPVGVAEPPAGKASRSP